jgi:hypothetical protein
VVDAIRDTLPLALGIALNPVAIGAGMLIFCRPDSRASGLAYAIGWIAGLTLLLVLSTWLSRYIFDALPQLPAELPWAIWIGLGGLFLAAAARVWRNRRPRTPAAPARWMRFVDGNGKRGTLGLGLFLSMVSPRNLTLLAAAAGIFGPAELDLLALGLTVAAFVAISSIGILVPLLVDLFGGQGADATLERWGDWLTRNMGAITAVVLALVGFYLLGRGITRVL